MFVGLKFPELTFAKTGKPLPPGIWHSKAGILWVGFQSPPFPVSPEQINVWLNHILKGEVDLEIVRESLGPPNGDMSAELDRFAQLFASQPTGLKAFVKKEKTPFHIENEVRDALQKFLRL